MEALKLPNDGYVVGRLSKELFDSLLKEALSCESNDIVNTGLMTTSGKQTCPHYSVSKKNADDLDPKMVETLNKQMNTLFSSATALYNQMLEDGVAKECARMVLPLCTPTRIYMTGSCRSWIHYINLRSAHGTQKEHMVIAEACRKVFTEQFPAVSEALEWV